jgi:SM-20-related protein
VWWANTFFEFSKIVIQIALPFLRLFSQACKPMENDFEALISGFILDRIGISNHFLTDELALSLRGDLLDMKEQSRLKTAGIGNDDKFQKVETVRGDQIYWLDRQNQSDIQDGFLDQMDGFVRYLNQTCYTGITSYEFHYAHYGPGSFYKRHLDQFENNSDRRFSMISYLNDNWQQGDGGELSVEQDGPDLAISPVLGKTVFFKSDELSHEVLLTHKPRLSVTGWLKRS